MKKFLAIILNISLIFSYLALPKTALATNTQIRQEVNITDGYMLATANNYATSSAIASIQDTNYSNPTYYFEVVASTTAGTTASVDLINATSSKKIATISINGGNTYTRYRSSAFLPNSSSTVEYKVVLNNENIGKGIIASRIVILQNAATLSNTETQIEIGNQENYSTAQATTTFASPKYWYYDSTKWDASPSYYLEVTYQAIAGIASSTTYSTSGTYTVNLPTGTASTSLEMWGGGGQGGGTTNANEGGDGGAGGQFASTTLVATSTNHTLVVAAASTPAGTGLDGFRGATTSWDGNLAVAGGGKGGLQGAGVSASTTGDTTGCVGDTCSKGGDAGAGSATYGGGGGGGAGTGGNGGSATGAGVAGTGTALGGGAGGTKTTSAGTGNAGNNFGGGGAGAWSSNGTDRTGGQGAQGQALVIDWVATTTIVLQVADGSGDGFINWTDVPNAYVVVGGNAHGNPTRVRTTTGFTPTNGRNYRLAFRNGDNRTQFAIYNAKIVVDQIAVPVTFVASSRATGTNSLALTLPTGWAIDDILIIEVAGTDAVSATFPAGYTVLNQTIGANPNTSIAWKRAVSGESNPTVTRTGATGSAIASLTAWRGATGAGGTGSPFSVVGTPVLTVVSATVNATAITPNSADLVMFFGATIDSSSVTFTYNVTNPSLTEVLKDVKNITGPTVFIATGISTTGTITGNNTVTDSSVTTSVGQLLSMIPANTGTPTKLQPQYLLADTKLFPGTALQNFLTSWDSTEWSTTNAYVHQAEAANGDTSVIELDTSGGVQITNSVINTIDNRATSTAMCMPANGNIDVKATTNSGNIFASRILVDVGGIPASCVVVGAFTPRFIFIGGFRFLPGLRLQ